MLSVPPARTTSFCPVKMELKALPTASIPEAQAHMTVLAGTASGIPARSAAQRAVLEKSEV